jgi:4-aminobutyrate aminotransferase
MFKLHEFSKIVVSPPGPKSKELLKKDEKIISPSLLRNYPLIIDSGKDCIVKDVDGNEFIDFYSSGFSISIGHSHPRIVEKIKKQAEKLIHFPLNDFSSSIAIELAEKLCEITPGNFDKKVFFSSSESESIDTCIKMLRWNTRKPLFLAFIGSFHGTTIGALSITANKPVLWKNFFPLMPQVIHLPYPYCYRCPFKRTYPECDYLCIDYIKDFLFQNLIPKGDVAAIFAEPIQSESGCIVPPKEYFKKLKRFLDEYEIPLVMDEARTSFGRTGRWFGIDHWDIVPEVICIANSMASGIPLAATISKAEIMDWEPGSHLSFSGGNPIACAVSLEIIEIIKEEKLIENSIKQGNHLMKLLKEIQEKYEIIGDVRGKGLMIGIEIVKDSQSKAPGIKEANQILKKSIKQGLLLFKRGQSTLCIAPPLTIKREIIEEGFHIIEASIKEVLEEIKH